MNEIAPGAVAANAAEITAEELAEIQKFANDTALAFLDFDHEVRSIRITQMSGAFFQNLLNIGTDHPRAIAAADLMMEFARLRIQELERASVPQQFSRA
ncbi:MAG: hypothetical protein ACRYHQ_35255 [Janthinobacterium lividum]